MSKLIYENKFDQTQEQWLQELHGEWQLEGKGILECNDGYLSMRSRIFTEERSEKGHFNLWLKRNFPVNAAYEWEFNYTRAGERGLAIAIWNCRGRGGEDAFDPLLPERRGEHMEDFVNGAVDCYHTSYIARGRKTANLRKNHGFHLIHSGPDLVGAGGPDRWHRVRIEQSDRLIRLLVNGEQCYAYRDEGQVGGGPILRGGMFAFRQQNNLHTGRYRNFKVYAL